MKKQAGQLIALLVVLAVLAAGFAALRRYNEEQANQPVEDTSIALNELTDEDIIRISYDYSDETYSFVKEDDTWYSEDDRELSITQNRITAMVAKLAPLKVDSALEEVTDYEQYGLDNPSRTIIYETADGSYTLYVGDYNSMEGIYYIMLENDSAVYIVQEKFLTVFNFTLEEVTEEEDEESAEAEEADDTEATDTETSDTETSDTETSETEEAVKPSQSESESVETER